LALALELKESERGESIIALNEEEVKDALRKIKNVDARRIIRTLVNLCSRVNGSPKLFIRKYSEKESAILSCMLERPLLTGEVAVGGIDLSTRSTLSLDLFGRTSWITIPPKWYIEVGALADKVRGYKVEVDTMTEYPKVRITLL